MGTHGAQRKTLALAVAGALLGSDSFWPQKRKRKGLSTILR